MRAGKRGVVPSLALFLVVSGLAGVLAAGLAIPFAGLAGYGTKQASASFEKLPQELVVPPLPVRSKIIDANGDLIAHIYEQNRVQVKLKDVSPILKKAVIAIEDARYYDHGALDAKGTLRALLKNKSEGGVTQGGSSITQQFVKMTLVQKATTEAQEKAAREETYQRKVKELRYAVAIEKQYSKDQIFEKYLNIAYFGDGAHGIEAAALHYFRVRSKDLNLPQAAMLAGLVKNPTHYDPTNSMRRAKERRDIVLRRMQELQVITPKQAAQAIKTPVIDLKRIQKVPNGCASSKYPFYCEYVVAKLLENKALGRTPAERERFINREGITVQTSIDPRIQAAAQASVDERSNPTDGAIAALTIVQPGTGLVKAMVQSRPYGRDRKAGRTSWNYNVEQSYGGGYGGFQNGSTMKAFVLAAAIQNGIPLSFRINSPDKVNMTNKVFQTCKGPYKLLSKWAPENSTKGGNIDLITATKNSVNTYFVQLEQRIGICAPATLATQLGVVNGKNDLGGTKQGAPLIQTPAFTLGVGSVTPLMMANAYATFAARGKYCKPLVVTGIKDKVGKAINTPGAECSQVMRAEHADGVNRVLAEVIKSGTGRNLGFGRAVAGKTGTTNSSKSVWFVGYTPSLAGATAIGDPDPPFQPLFKLRFGGRRLGFNDASGSRLAGPIWKDAMKAAHEGLPEENFVKPDPKVIKGDTVPLPSVSGKSPDEAANILREAGFQTQISLERVNSDQPEGTVAYTEPRRRDGAPSGSLVTIFISNGQRSPHDDQPPTAKPCPPWKPNCPRR